MRSAISALITIFLSLIIVFLLLCIPLMVLSSSSYFLKDWMVILMPDALIAVISLSITVLFFVLLYSFSVVQQRRRFFYSCLIYLFDGCDFRNKKYGVYSDFILFHFSTISSYCRIIEYEYQVHMWGSFSSTFGYLISFSRSFGVSKRALLSFLKKYNMEAFYNEADLYES